MCVGLRFHRWWRSIGNALTLISSDTSVEWRDHSYCREVKRSNIRRGGGKRLKGHRRCFCSVAAFRLLGFPEAVSVSHFVRPVFLLYGGRKDWWWIWASASQSVTMTTGRAEIVFLGLPSPSIHPSISLLSLIFDLWISRSQEMFAISVTHRQTGAWRQHGFVSWRHVRSRSKYFCVASAQKLESLMMFVIRF